MLLRARRGSLRRLTISLESRLIVRLHRVDDDEVGYRPYVVPDHAKVWVDMRLTSPTDTGAAINMVERAIVAAEAAVPGCHGSYAVTDDRPATERDPSSPLLAALKRAADGVTDADTTVGFFTGYTDTAVIAGKTGNRNCMSYGPARWRSRTSPTSRRPMPISFAARTCSSRLPTTRPGAQAAKLGHNKPRTNRLAR